MQERTDFYNAFSENKLRKKVSDQIISQSCSIYTVSVELLRVVGSASTTIVGSLSSSLCLSLSSLLKQAKQQKEVVAEKERELPNGYISPFVPFLSPKSRKKDEPLRTPRFSFSLFLCSISISLSFCFYPSQSFFFPQISRNPGRKSWRESQRTTFEDIPVKFFSSGMNRFEAI